jgi:amidohydrolase
MPNDPLLTRAQALREELVELRRDIHRHPEMAFHEERTSAAGQRFFEALGLAVQARIAGTTGLVATLDSGRPGRTLMIRADMDALPIVEASGADYVSRMEGVMHACGHDAHVACLLGAAKLLSEQKDRLRGKVKFVLQPAEEAPPGGAQVLIDQGGILDGVDAALALHVHAGFTVGQVGFRSGQMLAHSDRFEIVVRGVGGHAARPHLTVDAIAVAVQVYQALQYLVSRENDPLHPFVITVGSFHGGKAANVITDEVTMLGTTRCLDDKAAEQLPEKMERVVRGVCQAARAKVDFTFLRGYPALFNDPAFTEGCIRSAQGLLGDANVHRIARAEMGGEDFAYFSRRVPATMFRLGIRNEAKGIVHPVHSPRFNIDEDALPLGAAALARIAMDYVTDGT